MIGREPWFSGYGRSWVQIPAPDTQWSFFTLICFKNCIGFSKDRNKMEKRPRKTLSIPNIGCWFPLIRTTSSLNIPLWHKPTLSHTLSLSRTHDDQRHVQRLSESSSHWEGEMKNVLMGAKYSLERWGGGRGLWSVTIFGEISPLWRNFESLNNFFVG